jgi:autotransporter adhesin
VATTAALETVRFSMAGALAVTNQQFAALSGRVDGLEGQVGELFDLANTQRKDARQGIAAVAAMAQPAFPSADGKTSYASNVAYYRGEVGFSAGLMHRFSGSFALTAGASYGGGNNTALKAGVAGEF